jgi:FkbM family methyltransferase
MSMRIVRGLQGRAANFYKLYVRRDPFFRAVTKWFADNGDGTLRLDYPLDDSSVVFDVGGYHGDFADAIYRKFRCRVFVFEPVPEFHQHCVQRFHGNPSIACLNYGLAANSGWLPIQLSEDGSSFKRETTGAPAQSAQVRSIVEVVAELGLKGIDLIKINIEGGEFDLLPALIESGLVRQTGFIQVQFHDFIAGATAARESIRKSLGRTHREMWCYPFVWESWERI